MLIHVIEFSAQVVIESEVASRGDFVSPHAPSATKTDAATGALEKEEEVLEKRSASLTDHLIALENVHFVVFCRRR